MKCLLILLTCCVPLTAMAQQFSCPAGQADVMKYFVLDQNRRHDYFLGGTPNSIYTELFPSEDFAPSGYWFWLKSPKSHGFDVKAFDEKYIYMRATELTWDDNSSFKRFDHDLPIAARCVPEGGPGPQIKVPDTRFQYSSSCRPYKSSTLGTAVNDLDAPKQMEIGGNIGAAWTRVLHYEYNCDKGYQNCKDEEQFYLANAYGIWQWKHYRNGELVKTALMNDLREGKPGAGLPCAEAYR
jgi:hypothetical protein